MRAANQRPGDVAEYSCCPDIDGLEVLHARWVDHSFTPHMHDFYAISLNDGGRGVFDCRREAHDAAPGTCNLVEPGELHTGRPAARQGWRYRNLHIDVPLMTRLLEGVGARRTRDISFTASLVQDPVLSQQLQSVLASVSEPGSVLQSESLLLALVARLVSFHSTDGRGLRTDGWEHASVTRVREWLDAHSERTVSLRALADLAGLSPYYLVRAFRRQVGVPPHQYQKMVRVNRARKLLAQGRSPSEAAQLAGFCDQSHLNRCFKQTVGVPPGRYTGAHRARHSRRS